MPVLMQRIGRSIAGSKAFARAAKARSGLSGSGVFATLPLDDYSLEAERKIEKLFGRRAINLR
jgi:hypothetical protein